MVFQEKGLVLDTKFIYRSVSEIVERQLKKRGIKWQTYFSI